MMTVTKDSHMQTFPNLPHQQSKHHAPGIKLALRVYEQALGSKTTIGEHAVKKDSMVHRATLTYVHICTYNIVCKRHIRMYTDVCTYVHTYVCMYVHMYVCV